jgi:hypothetical protein
LHPLEGDDSFARECIFANVTVKITETLLPQSLAGDCKGCTDLRGQHGCEVTVQLKVKTALLSCDHGTQSDLIGHPGCHVTVKVE